MTKNELPSPAWLEQALRDPASVFASPEEAARHPALTLEQRIAALRSWEYDAAELSVAEEEGMQGPEGDLLSRILRALNALTPQDDTEQVAPSKQHGLL